MTDSLWKFRRRHPPAWFVRWYFRHCIARDRCPCALAARFAAFRGKRWSWLVYWCSRMDDEYERLEHMPFYAWVLNQTTTSSNSVNVSVKWWRTHHG